MSFSGMVKEELFERVGNARHCNLAELAAILMNCAVLVKDPSGKPVIRISTENEYVARKCFTLLRKTYNIESVVSIHDSFSRKRGKVYLVELSEESFGGTILQGTKMVIDGNNGTMTLQDHSLILQKDCCKRAFLRGAFLSAGSLSDPHKGYHFEIVFPTEEKAELLQRLIGSFRMDARIVQRKKSYVVYVKEGAQIVDLLGLMGASRAVMELENIRILKEMRNSVNRQVNCETANINKTVNAAVKQIEDIRYIERVKGFESLRDNLAEIAGLRLQYPEATLKELGMMLNPQVGKSGVNHRLRKLSVIADELRENEEELL